MEEIKCSQTEVVSVQMSITIPIVKRSRMRIYQM